MVNGNSASPKINGAKINGKKSIFFERTLDGGWTAKTETADGEIAGTGATILEARLAFDKALLAASQRKPKLPTPIPPE